MVKKLAVALVAIVLLAIAAWAMSAAFLSRVVEARIISALSENFASSLEFTKLEVSVFPRIKIQGEGIVFHLKDRPDAPPLFEIRTLTARANLLGLIFKHVSSVRLEGLDIHVPPRKDNPAPPGPHGKNPPRFVIDEIIADGTTLTTLPRDASKDPLVFQIQQLRLYGGGPQDPMKFDAVLMNAKPPGEIRSSGSFGPWDRTDPGGTAVSGKYTFRDADLSVFKGIAGILSSDGQYHGSLGHINVAGTTDVPDFRLAIAGNPVHLTTQFAAVVDGTDGNTYLQPVNGHFGHTSLVAQGSVEGTKGIPGKTVSLDVVVQDGRLEDMLLLAVKGQPSMRGAVHFHTKLVIPPGDVDVAEKVNLDGALNMDSVKFSKLDVQEKVNELSHRSEGHPTESNDENSVASDFKGQFKVGKGIVTLTGLSFTVPGISVNLNGTYGLLNTEMNFRGTALLAAKVSQTTTGWKSFLLKAADPFFKRKQAGAEIPIRITGTPDKPSFGLAL